MKSNLSTRRYLAALVIAVTLAVGIVIGTFVSRTSRVARILPDPASMTPLSVPSPVSLSNSFARIAANLTPAVVNIRSESIIRFDKNGKSGPHSGLFNHFFGFGPGGVPHPGTESVGSGVILDKHGYILTNYHVVADEGGQPVQMIRVHLQGDDDNVRGYNARIVAYDKPTDLAVLKIDARRPLPTAQLGNSDAVRVGDWVVAIGSPFNLNATVTAGIISAKGREFNETQEDEFKSFLQTDAAINPGNSGGPLVNLSGQVVGINTAIATTRGAYDGVGFAIPSNLARKVYNDLVREGSVRRGAIGVTFMQLQTPALLQSFGVAHGVVVDSVKAGSPAARAGLEPGDVITAIDSRPIRDGSQLLNAVSNTNPGQRLGVDFLRNGKHMSARMTVADWNKIAGAELDAAPSPAERGASPDSAGRLGLTVKGLAPDQAKEISARLRRSQVAGVLVDDVEPGSFADDLAVARFDVILSINHQDVHSVADFNRIQSHLRSGEDVLLMIARRTGAGYTTFFLADQLP